MLSGRQIWCSVCKTEQCEGTFLPFAFLVLSPRQRGNMSRNFIPQQGQVSKCSHSRCHGWLQKPEPTIPSRGQGTEQQVTPSTILSPPAVPHGCGDRFDMNQACEKLGECCSSSLPHGFVHFRRTGPVLRPNLKVRLFSTHTIYIQVSFIKELGKHGENRLFTPLCPMCSRQSY